MMKYYYEGIERLDWGFGNPNIAAALIIQLMVLSWVFAFIPLKGSLKKLQSLFFIGSLSSSTWFGSKCKFGSKTPKQIMGARIRQPGGYHEHLMVSKQLVFKKMGNVKMQTIKKWRTKIKDVKFKNGTIHGNNPTSCEFHAKLAEMTDKCKNISQFKKGLNELADIWFVNGRKDLPKELIL